MHEMKENHLCLRLSCSPPSLPPFCSYSSGFTGLVFLWDDGQHLVVLCSTEELLRLPKSLGNWGQSQEVSYQTCLLPQVSRSGPQSLGFFYFRFVLWWRQCWSLTVMNSTLLRLKTSMGSMSRTVSFQVCAKIENTNTVLSLLHHFRKFQHQL